MAHAANTCIVKAAGLLKANTAPLLMLTFLGAHMKSDTLVFKNFGAVLVSIYRCGIDSEGEVAGQRQLNPLLTRRP